MVLLFSNVFFDTQHTPYGRHGQEKCADARENCPDDKIGPKDGGMPSGLNGRGQDPGDNSVD